MYPHLKLSLGLVLYNRLLTLVENGVLDYSVVYIFKLLLTAQVTGLNSLLAEARSELMKHQSLVKKIQHDLEGARRELSFRQESEGKLQAELEICCNKLKQTDEEKLKLQNELIQVDIRLRSSKEAETRKEGEIQRKLNGIENKFVFIHA